MIDLYEYIQEGLKVNSKSKFTSQKDKSNPYNWEIGDVIYCVYSYTMTLPYFFKIVKKTPKGFGIVELSQKIVSGHRNGSFEVIPDDSKLSEDLKGKVKTCRIGKNDTVKFGYDRLTMYYWDGKPVWGDDMD